MENFSKKISNLFLWIMNIGLLTVGILLSFGLLIELKEIVVEGMKFITDTGSYQHFIEEILVFFSSLYLIKRKNKLKKLNKIPNPKKIIIPVTIVGIVVRLRLFICSSYLEIENLKLLLQQSLLELIKAIK